MTANDFVAVCCLLKSACHRVAYGPVGFGEVAVMRSTVIGSGSVENDPNVWSGRAQEVLSTPERRPLRRQIDPRPMLDPSQVQHRGSKAGKG